MRESHNTEAEWDLGNHYHNPSLFRSKEERELNSREIEIEAEKYRTKAKKEKKLLAKVILSYP